MHTRAIASLRSHSRILLHTALVVLPLFAFTAILLGLVYWNLWGQRSDANALSLDSGFESNVLYVNYSATSLILVASWSSSVSIPLVGSLLTLTSFVVAAELLWTSEKSLQSLLPTAAQLGLLTELLDGRKLALWTWFAGLWRSGDQKVPSRWIIDLAVGVQLAGVFFSIAIVAADTWLHVATSSITWWYLASIPDPSALGPSYHYSRTFSGTCLNMADDTCSVKLTGNPATNQTSYSRDIKDLLNNNHPDTSINGSADGSLFLAPRLPNQVDLPGNDNSAFQTFTAATIAVSATCDKSLDLCSFSQSNPNSSNWQFNCNPGGNGMQGTLSPENWLSISSWWRPNDSTDAYNDAWKYYKHEFGFDTTEVGIVAFLQDVNVTSGSTPNGPSTSWKPSFNGSVIGTKCNITTINASYKWTNATSLTNPAAMTDGTSNSTGVALARAALLAGYFDSESFDQDQKSKLGSRLRGNGYISDTNLGQQIQYTAALAGLSLLGGTFESTPATALALPDSAIVTQVKKAPLFTLIVLNLWYVGFALCLGCLTVYVLRDETTRQDIKAIQKLVTINGLATSMVGRHAENLSARGTDTRIGVEKVDGKWQFKIFESPGAEEGKALLSTEESSE